MHLQGEPSGRNDVDLDSHIIPGQEGFPADINPPKRHPLRIIEASRMNYFDRHSSDDRPEPVKMGHTP